MPATLPAVDTIIVNYNSGMALHDTLAQLLSQLNPGRTFVVDNGSTDGSLERLDYLADGDRRVVIIRNSVNLGFAGACNQPLPQCQGEYVLYLNPDCIMTPGALDSLLAVMVANPQVAMAGPLVVNPDGSEQAGGRRAVPTPWRSFVRAAKLTRLGRRYPSLFSDFLLHKQPLPDTAAEVEAISGACMLVRRKALDAVGSLDEGYFLHCEDLDWCMRFRGQGWKILFVPDARVIHHKGMCSRSRPIFVEWHKHRGMIRFYRKFFRHQYPGAVMWLVVFGVWLRFGLMVAYYTAHRVGRWLGWRGE